MRCLLVRLCAILAALPLCLLCPRANAQIGKTAPPVVNPSTDLFAQAPVGPNTAEAERVTVRTLTSSTASYSNMLALSWSVSRKRSLSVSVENMKVSSFYIKMPGLSEKPDWYFKSIPVTMSIEQEVGNPDWRITPVVGAGGSLYLSKTRTRRQDDPYSFDRSLGAGIGAQLTAGIKTRITDNTFFISQARYRLIDGVGLTAHNPDYKFGLLDFVIGFGVDF